MWPGIVSFLGSIQSIRLKSLNSISKLELDTVLEKKGKEKNYEVCWLRRVYYFAKNTTRSNNDNNFAQKFNLTRQ